jgi:hypothetical protein
MSVAVCGVVELAGRQTPMGGTTWAIYNSRKCKSLTRWGEAANGKTASSKTIYREITRRFVER